MDYETKPTSRKTLRRLSVYFRELFDVQATGAFPVLEALEKFPGIFKGSTIQIVEDERLPPCIMAQCTPNEKGGFDLEIKESVYDGAYRNGNGACLGFICHEMCHAFLYKIGYTPILARSFNDREIPPYRSVEWQAKALCGEVMIPYGESRWMDQQQIIDTYHVSKAFAKVRRKLAAKEEISDTRKKHHM